MEQLLHSDMYGYRTLIECPKNYSESWLTEFDQEFRNYKTLMYGFRVSSCQRCVRQYFNVTKQQLNCTTTPKEWREKAGLFGQKWNFHHAMGV